jgi:hypothetical protein
MTAGAFRFQVGGFECISISDGALDSASHRPQIKNEKP